MGRKCHWFPRERDRRRKPQGTKELRAFSRSCQPSKTLTRTGPQASIVLDPGWFPLTNALHTPIFFIVSMRRILHSLDRSPHRKGKGFTLIDLLILIPIIPTPPPILLPPL